MSKKLQLTIAEPCHENWDDMSPVEKGKFCGSCQKQVIDFSHMSDRQVAEFFKKPSTGSVCGRFMTDQLDREIEIPRKRIPWIKYFFQIALPALLVSVKVSAQKTPGINKVATKDTSRRMPLPEQTRTLGMVARPEGFGDFKADTDTTTAKEPLITLQKQLEQTPAIELAEALVGKIAVKKDTTLLPPTCSPIMGTIAYVPPANRLTKNELAGLVVDEFGQAVPFATLETGKAGEMIMADENGTFRIKKAWLGKGNLLTVSSTGFDKVRIKAGTEEYLDGKLYVRMHSNIILPEVVITTTMGITRSTKVVGYTTATVKGEILATQTTTETNSLPTISEEDRLLVYPNPVMAGMPLHLSFKKMEEGYYQFLLFSQAGQTLHQKEIWIDSEARVMDMEIPAVSAGAYFIVLTNKKTGKKYSEKFIIQ